MKKKTEVKTKTKVKTKPMSDIEIRDITKPGKTLEVTFTIPVTICMTVSETGHSKGFDYTKWINEARPKVGYKLIETLEDNDKACTEHGTETFEEIVKEELWNDNIKVNSVVYK